MDKLNTPSPSLAATIILIRGLPGSGKSFIADGLQKALGSNTILLDPDTIESSSHAYQEHVQQMQKDGVDEALYPYRFLRAQAYEGIAGGKTVIWNQPFTNLDMFQRMTAKFYAQAEAYGKNLRLLVVEVAIDPDVALERIRVRKQAGGHGPSEATFARFRHDYQSCATAGYKVVSVRGDEGVDKAVDTIVAALNQA